MNYRYKSLCIYVFSCKGKAYLTLQLCFYHKKFFLTISSILYMTDNALIIFNFNNDLLLLQFY